jgi:hypothetical protein
MLLGHRMERYVLVAAGWLGAAVLCAQTAASPPEPPVSGFVNGQLPRWLRFSGEERARVEGLTGIGFRPAEDLWLLNRLRLNLEARPWRWLKFTFQAQDARAFGQNTRPAPATQKNAIDLRQGYVDLGSEHGPATLRAGRQPLAFGEGRLLGDPSWSNVGRAFDAARLSLRHGKVKADLFTGVVVKVTPGGWDHPAPGEHLHGLYATLDRVAAGATLDAYVLWRLAHDFQSERGGVGHLSAQTTGFRLVGKLPGSIDYGVEAAGQTGSIAGDRVRAWAGHWLVGYTLADTRHKPRLFTEYNRASGDADPRDGRRGTFDPLFPAPHDKYGLADLFTWANLAHWRGGAEYTLREGLVLSGAYNSFWLANLGDGLYAGGKVIAHDPDHSAGGHVGREADFQMMWTATRTTSVNAGYARLFPGVFLKHATPGAPLNYMFAGIAHRF